MTTNKSEFYRELLSHVEQMFNNFEVEVVEYHHLYSFYYSDAACLYFWNMSWDLTKDNLFIPFQKITLNSHTICLPVTVCQELSEMSAEYAVMYKLRE